MITCIYFFFLRALLPPHLIPGQQPTHTPFQANKLESDEDIEPRLVKLFDLINNENYKNIAIVSHGEFIFRFLHKYGNLLKIEAKKKWDRNYKEKSLEIYGVENNHVETLGGEDCPLTNEITNNGHRCKGFLEMI